MLAVIGSDSCTATTKSARPAKGWANHATVMGYFLHRIKDERTLYRGQEIRGGTHSFLRGKVWHCGRAESRRRTDVSNHAGRFFSDGVSACASRSI